MLNVKPLPNIHWNHNIPFFLRLHHCFGYCSNRPPKKILRRRNCRHPKKNLRLNCCRHWKNCRPWNYCRPWKKNRYPLNGTAPTPPH